MVEWTSIRVQIALKKKIEALIKEKPELGYTSIASFVSDACRRRLNEIKQDWSLPEDKIRALVQQEIEHLLEKK